MASSEAIQKAITEAAIRATKATVFAMTQASKETRMLTTGAEEAN